MQVINKFILILFIIISASTQAFAEVSFRPYFASIKSSEVNVRIGPNVRYPIKWVYVKKNEPVEITASFELWYKIRDIEGEYGWVKASMISSKRFLIIKGEKPIDLFKKNDNAQIIAKLEPGIRVELENCSKKLCYIKIGTMKGWVSSSNVWGIYPNEFE